MVALLFFLLRLLVSPFRSISRLETGPAQTILYVTAMLPLVALFAEEAGN
jgi:hypothetical protein